MMIQVKLIVAVIAGVLLSAPRSTSAQDPARVGPDIYKLKLSEKGVRVFEVSFKPKQKIAPHSHPDHIVYALTNGQITITEEGKEGKTMDVKAGDAMYLPAQTHHAENGNKALKLLVVELPRQR